MSTPEHGRLSMYNRRIRGILIISESRLEIAYPRSQMQRKKAARNALQNRAERNFGEFIYARKEDGGIWTVWE